MVQKNILALMKKIFHFLSPGTIRLPYIKALWHYYPSTIPAPLGVYSLRCELPHSKLNTHINHICSHKVPILPLGGEKLVVKCLAQGHKCHNRDFNYIPMTLTTRTWVWCSYTPGHNTHPLRQTCCDVFKLYLVHNNKAIACTGNAKSLRKSV